MKREVDPYRILSGASPPPPGLDVATRVRLLHEAAHALLDRRMPSDAAALLLGGAVSAWLQGGGDLVRDYLRIKARPGSHRTPANIARGLASSRAATDSPAADNLPPSVTD